MQKDEILNYLASQLEPYTISVDHPAYPASVAQEWSYQELPLNQIRLFNSSSEKEEMIFWFKQEVSLWTFEYGPDDDKPNRWLELEKYFVANPTELPIIVFQGTDGYYYLNDGHHRLAIAYKHEFATISCIVALIK